MSESPSQQVPKRRHVLYKVLGRKPKDISCFVRKLTNFTQTQQENEFQFQYKKRKITLTDQTDLTNPQEYAYEKLIQFERKIDNQITKKRKELQQIFASPPQTLNGRLRVHLFNTFFNKAEQNYWALRIQAKLLYPDNKIYQDKSNEEKLLSDKRFSSFMKNMVITIQDLTQEKIELKYPLINKDADGYEIKRLSNGECDIKIQIYLKNVTQKYQLSRGLSQVLGIQEVNRWELLKSFWFYIRQEKLQIEQNRTLYLNQDLQDLFNVQRIQITDIFNYLLQHLQEIPPVELTHRISLTKP